LGAVPPERLPALRLALHPAARLVVSEQHPIHTIWAAATAGAALPDPPPAQRQTGFVPRASRPPQAFRPRGGATPLPWAIAAGAPLEKALAEAAAAAPGFDLSAALAAALSRGVFGAEVSFDPSPIGGVS